MKGAYLKQAGERDGWPVLWPLYEERPTASNHVDNVVEPLDQLKDVLINEEFSELVQFLFRLDVLSSSCLC